MTNAAGRRTAGGRTAGGRKALPYLLCAALITVPSVAAAWPTCKEQPLPAGASAELGADPTLRADLDALLQDAVESGETPAAALVVLRQGKVLFRGAAGAARPESIFDLASLTKVVATAPLVLSLVQQGKLGLDDPAARHLPLLKTPDKSRITVRQLLTHTSGLPSVIWKGRPGEGRTELLPRISSAKLKHAPGSAWLYSDAGFIALGELAARLGGGALGPLAERKLFVPLGMCATGFSPPARLAPRLVSSWPAHKEVKRLRKGQAYDPLAARMGGVSGHAGLFSTADDLARFGQMMLKEGTRGDAKVLEPASVRSMIRPHPLPGAKGQRGLGWDINSPHASGKGQLSPGAYGHTGYTGTSLWVDPERRLVVALLTNRSRFRPMPSANGLRRRVHNTVVEALLEPPDTPVKTGLDRLVEEEFKQLRGRKIGLITNRSAVDGRGRWIGDLLTRAEGVRVEALFVPEHGLGADVDRHVKDGAVKLGDRTVKVYSLFGPHRRPRPEALAGLDTLVFDVPVVGVRYYTYLATMGWAMEEAARFKLRFMVLDRPDPLGGVKVQGPLSSARRRTSANYHPLPVRYGMTTGELARLYNRERRIKARLEIIKVQGWKRGQDFRRQGLPWRNPSPNIRTHRQALLYGAVGLLEGTNLAVGRGTDSPFQLVGAPWIDHRSLLGYLRRLNPPGVHFSLASFTPASSRHRGKACQGVRLTVTDSSKLDPVRVGVTLAVALRRLYRARWKTAKLYRIISHPPTTRAILSGQMVKRVTRLWAKGLSRFLKIRERYLLY